MSKIDNLKRKYGGRGIPNLPLWITIAFVIGYILYFLFSPIYEMMTLNPYAIFVDHEYWRFLTWIVTVPITPTRPIDFILIPICIYFYHYIARQLEQIWGTLMFNIYILGQLVLLDLAVFLMALTTGRVEALALPGTRYMVLSMYLAMAVIFPNMKVLFMFIFPVKMKYLALLDLGFVLYEYVVLNSIYWRLTIIICVGVFGLFYFLNLKSKMPTMKQAARKRKFRAAVNKGQFLNASRGDYKRNVTGTTDSNLVDGRKRFKPVVAKGQAMHRCSICGRSELDDDTLDFRYCSKCKGDKEYCSEHIFTHTHVE